MSIFGHIWAWLKEQLVFLTFSRLVWEVARTALTSLCLLVSFSISPTLMNPHDAETHSKLCDPLSSCQWSMKTDTLSLKTCPNLSHYTPNCNPYSLTLTKSKPKICVVGTLFLSQEETALTVCVCVCSQGVSGLSDQPSTGADGGVEESSQHSGQRPRQRYTNTETHTEAQTTREDRINSLMINYCHRP